MSKMVHWRSCYQASLQPIICLYKSNSQSDSLKLKKLVNLFVIVGIISCNILRTDTLHYLHKFLCGFNWKID